MRVLSLAGFQLLHPRHERRDLRPQGSVLGVEGGDFFGWRHASMLHLLRNSA